MKLQSSRKPLVLLTSPPSAIPLSLLLLHSLLPPLYWQEALKWEWEKELVEEPPPDLSYRKVSHQNDVSSTALVSSFDEFEDMKEDPSPLTIIQQKREGIGKENKLNTAHIISTVKFISTV